MSEREFPTLTDAEVERLYSTRHYSFGDPGLSFAVAFAARVRQELRHKWAAGDKLAQLKALRGMLHGHGDFDQFTLADVDRERARVQAEIDALEGRGQR